MSYSTGTSTGPKDLLDKLRLFLIADGWSVNLWTDDDTTFASGWSGIDGDGKRLHVQKTASSGGPTMYFNFRAVIRGIIFDDYYTTSSQWGGKYYSEITGIAMYGSTGYDGGQPWYNQPGHPENNAGETWGACMTELSTTAIPAYYFFSDEDTVVVVVEYSSGKFEYLSFGCLEKEGVYTGGQFFAGSVETYRPSLTFLHSDTYTYSTGFFSRLGYSSTEIATAGVYVDMDSTVGWYASGATGSEEATDFSRHIQMPGIRPNGTGSYIYTNTFLTIGMTRSPNFYNSLAPFWPIFIWGKRSDGNYSLLGTPASIRILNPEYYDPAEEVVLGSDTWMIFPGHDPANDDDGRLGFAIKKVT